MGRFRFESNRMKVLIAGLLCATVALALPEGRRLRAEEHWRPAQGRDLSKYKPRHAMVPATKEDLSWAIKEVKKNGASTKKGTNIDLKATCGIEGPAAAERIVMKAGMKAAGQAWNQVGIVSFGSSAGCEVGFPAGFTRTEYYLDWITSETGM